MGKKMKYKITYTDSTNLLVIKTDGKMNADDFLTMAGDLLRHPRRLPGGDVIFDHTAMEFNDVSVDDLQKIRAFHLSNEESIGKGKSAIVVKAGLSKAWHKLWSQGRKIKTGNKVQVFDNYNDAANWILKGTI